MHRGIYNFNQQHFGMKVAPVIFQQVLGNMLADFDFSVAYLDEILIKSVSKVEYVWYVKTIIQKLGEYGFKFREEKCEFLLPKIKYLGQIIWAYESQNLCLRSEVDSVVFLNSDRDSTVKRRQVLYSNTHFSRLCKF